MFIEPPPPPPRTPSSPSNLTKKIELHNNLAAFRQLTECTVISGCAFTAATNQLMFSVAGTFGMRGRPSALVTLSLSSSRQCLRMVLNLYPTIYCAGMYFLLGCSDCWCQGTARARLDRCVLSVFGRHPIECPCKYCSFSREWCNQGILGRIR